MKKLALAVSLAAGLALQPVAHAGLNSNSSVYVFTSSSGNSAQGSFHDARFNSGSTENIGCYRYVSVSTSTGAVTTNLISCSATNASGASYYCYMYNPPAAWTEMVVGMNEASNVYFYGDAAHRCLTISISNNSMLL